MGHSHWALAGTLAAILFLGPGCAGRLPKTVGEQGESQKRLEPIRRQYFDTADIPGARAGLAGLVDRRAGSLPDGVFDLQARLDRVEALQQAVASYQAVPEEAACASDLNRIRLDLAEAASLLSSSFRAEKVKLSGLQRGLRDAQTRLQECVVRQAQSLSEQDRLLASSTDPAVLRPLVDQRDASLVAEGGLDDILPYLRRTSGMRHSQDLIDKTDRLVRQSGERDLMVAYLYYYGDYRHDDALFADLDRLFFNTEDWAAIEAYLQRFHNRPHLPDLETKLLRYYQDEFDAGARLFDQEKFAEASGHLASVAPRSPQYGPARSLLSEAARMGYYRWELPEAWVLVPPYRW